MYWALLIAGSWQVAETYMARGGDAVGHADRPGMALVLAGLAFGWHEHRLGQFAQLKKKLSKRPAARSGGAAGGTGRSPAAAFADAGGMGRSFFRRRCCPAAG